MSTVQSCLAFEEKWEQGSNDWLIPKSRVAETSGRLSPDAAQVRGAARLRGGHERPFGSAAFEGRSGALAEADINLT